MQGQSAFKDAKAYVDELRIGESFGYCLSRGELGESSYKKNTAIRCGKLLWYYQS